MPRISLRLTREQYRALKLLVEEGVFPSISDALREAIVKLLKGRVMHTTHRQT